MDIIKPFPLLSQEVGEWSHRNFGNKQDPYLGMIEELGELAHCLLKRWQQIRGYEDPKFFLEQFTDALGDIGIYAANFAYNNHLNIHWPVVRGTTPQVSQTVYVAQAAFWLSHLKLTPESQDDLRRWLHHFLLEIGVIAKLEQLELDEVVCGVWETVKLRDWTQDAKAGVTQVS